MADSDARLTLEGLARILRDHMDGTTAQFAEVGARLDAVGVRIDRLARIVEGLTQLATQHHEEIAEHRRLHEEHRQYIRQVFTRMEQSDARIEGMTRDIRRILDTMERRGGDGGPAEP